jgi:hypothetical protein
MSTRHGESTRKPSWRLCAEKLILRRGRRVFSEDRRGQWLRQAHKALTQPCLKALFGRSAQNRHSTIPSMFEMEGGIGNRNPHTNGTCTEPEQACRFPKPASQTAHLHRPAAGNQIPPRKKKVVLRYVVVAESLRRRNFDERQQPSAKSSAACRYLLICLNKSSETSLEFFPRFLRKEAAS